MTARQVLNTMSFVSLASAFILVAVVVYWLLYPYNPIVFKDKLFPVANPIVKQGQIFEYISRYCKDTDLSAIVTTEFKNDLIFVTPSVITNRDKGCATITVGTFVPRELPPGVYTVGKTYQYQVNPIRVITVTQETEPITVVSSGR